MKKNKGYNKGYRYAIMWVAENVNPGDDDDFDIIKGYMTVLLVADLFGIVEDIVAKDVIRYRSKNK